RIPPDAATGRWGPHRLEWGLRQHGLLGGDGAGGGGPHGRQRPAAHPQHTTGRLPLHLRAPAEASMNDETRALYRAAWVLPVTSPPIRGGAVLVDSTGRIAAVG